MREIFDGYYCMADYCNKELVDGIPPCNDCENIISFEDFAEIQTRFIEK